MTAKKLAFSYIRFSLKKQAKGGSLKRQTQWSQDWCKRKGALLDETLTLHDLGVSAFRGKNLQEGALAGFLEACRMGRVPRGSYLLVENLDRLSRQEIRPALQIFLALQDYGITIVTAEPEREYSPDASDALALIEPLIIFARAHEESAMKSYRRKDGWKQARDRARTSGEPLMKTCPGWLEVTQDGYQVREWAAETYRRIQRLCLDEGMGVERIAALLDAEKIKPFGWTGKWNKNYIYKMLTNPAAIGTHQPCKLVGKQWRPDGEPIPNYYPTICSEEDFYRVKETLRSRAGGKGAGRVAKDMNLFSKLARCAVTKQFMQIVHAMGKPQPDGTRKRYYYLASVRENGVVWRKFSIDYFAFEQAILRALMELRPRDLATSKEEDQADGQAEITELSGRLVDIDSKLARAKERAVKSQDFDSFLDLIQDLNKERRTVMERIAALRSELKANPCADLGETQSLIQMLENANEEQRVELRRRLKVRIRALVTEIWVLVQGRGSGKKPRHAYVQIHLRSGGIRNLIVYHPQFTPGVRPLPKGTDLRKYMPQLQDAT